MAEIQISILIPTFNRFSMLCDALDQIIKYDCQEVFEVIVSDNHSSDGTLEKLASRYQNFRKLKLTKPPISSGPLPNWEHALSQASGTHVHWHWSDDYLCGPFYSEAAKLMRHENANVLISAVSVINDSGLEVVIHSQGNLKMESTSIALKKLLIHETLPVSPAACILPLQAVKKHFYKNIPAVFPYDPIKWAMGTDALMIAGSLLENDNVAYLERPLFCFRDHQTSLTKLHSKFFKSYFVSFEWFIRKNKVPISLSERRKKFGLIICNAFEKKFSKDYFVGNVLQAYKIFISKIQKQ